MSKPRIFIGNYKDSGEIADLVRGELASTMNVDRWDLNEFELGRCTTEGIEKLCNSYDGGVFVFDFEETQKLNYKTHRSTRDKVMFELGAFMGQLGRKRCIVLTEQSLSKETLPSNLAGVVYRSYVDSDAELNATIGEACAQIYQHFKRECKGPNFVNEKDPMICKGLELAVRATCLPKLPENIDIRAFLFKAVGEKLLFHDKWVLHDTTEDSNISFNINERLKPAVVVKAYITGEPQAEPIEKNEQAELGRRLKVESRLRFVLAAPIFLRKKCWGVVDFDTTTVHGAKVLSSMGAKAMMRQLAQQIGNIVGRRIS